MKPIEVEILGRKYRLRSDNPEQTQNIAYIINEELNRLQELYENLDFTKLILLLALRKQDEIISLQKQNQELEKNLERVNQMVEKIVGDI
ncbi:MAG: cell division protein ZapA [Candidatus Cloacimonadaceae bacterium]|jgi:cell division protein ZapA (FtsZ GTPase activity inhibitor)|nr:cell division protein ZapA [Candidatus Cloacimonadota bacterium]MCB5258772.1 cell division protein ZapA [Candidatus Cloacimonadota bacterium]MDD5625368.1 cell division protein ZapA [Candidatus Cloacimonadota bacterium]MDY0111830.1 cell division protein ZapA [Candidatus Syntrophosphaera sp.]